MVMEYLVIFMLVLVASLCGSLLANKLSPREVILPSKEGNSLTGQFMSRVEAMEAAIFKMVHGVTQEELYDAEEVQNEWLFGEGGRLADGEEESQG